MSESDPAAVRAAAFLAQALGLPDDPRAVAADLTPVDDDRVVTVFAAEVDSSVGPAAFLVYGYDLAATDDEGRTGEARYAEDLATLERAAALDAPGPRAVAQARVEGYAFVLATTPDTLRALSGEVPAAAGGDEGTLPAGADPETVRRESATELLRLLRLANAQAVAWSLAVATDAPAGPSALTSEETELALSLLEEGSITPLLALIDRLLTTARAAGYGGSAADG